MTAITIPRQPDGAFKGANAFAPQPLDFTGNFFPRESHGTNVSKILYPLYVWNFTDETSSSNPIFQVFKVLLCTKLQQFLARFLVLENIIYRLKPLFYKDLMSKLLSYRARFHPASKLGDFPLAKLKPSDGITRQ